MQPVYFIPHGGGPCFFMDWTMGPSNTWDKTAEWLKSIVRDSDEPPRAILVVSAHWEEPVVTLQSGQNPPMLFDYYGFPKHTYELKWPAPGAPNIAARISELLREKGIEHSANDQRGFDHGTFIPLLLSVPKAHIPTLQISLKRGLDPAFHIALGEALSPLRKEGVLIIGSGMSYHNMRGFNTSKALADSQLFDAWLTQTVEAAQVERTSRLVNWEKAPAARDCHPREEHLLPLMVAAGAAKESKGSQVFQDVAMGCQLSGFRFA